MNLEDPAPAPCTDLSIGELIEWLAMPQYTNGVLDFDAINHMTAAAELIGKLVNGSAQPNGARDEIERLQVDAAHWKERHDTVLQKHIECCGDPAQGGVSPFNEHWGQATKHLQSVYDELCVRFSGVHSDDAMDSVLLRLHAALKALRVDPMASSLPSTKCGCSACRDAPHSSDCAVHNAPALPVGPCDCSISQQDRSGK